MEFEPGKSTLVFLDNGAIIDAEAELTRWKFYDSSANIGKMYSLLQKPGINLYVTAPVFGETTNHYKHNRKGGRLEISEANYDIVKGLHGDYEKFLQNVQKNDKERDALRRDVYWASILAFEDDEKKKTRDPISYVDRDLVSSAVLAKYSHFPHHIKGKDGKIETIVKEPDKVVVLSPDSHVEKTIN